MQKIKERVSLALYYIRNKIKKKTSNSTWLTSDGSSVSSAALYGRVIKFKINESDCDKATYTINVTKTFPHLVRENPDQPPPFEAGEQISIRTNVRESCVCPWLEVGKSFFLMGRFGKNRDRNGAVRYTMKPKDVAIPISEWRETQIVNKEFEEVTPHLARKADGSRYGTKTYRKFIRTLLLLAVDQITE